MEVALKDVLMRKKKTMSDYSLDHLCTEISKLLKDGFCPRRSRTGLIKKSIGINCSTYIRLLKASVRFCIQRKIPHRHWFIERPSPRCVFHDNDTEVVMDSKMRNKAIDKSRAYKRESHGSRKRGGRSTDKILSTFERECLDNVQSSAY